jgi:uncharacterized protein
MTSEKNDTGDNLMLSRETFQHARRYAQDGSLFPDSEYHGDDHWRAVAYQGLLLSSMMVGGQRGRSTALLFGLFHDCRRENDGFDQEHGPRGAQAFLDCDHLMDLDDNLRHTLAEAMISHDRGETTQHPFKAIGWDADRSTLGRVDITPTFNYFSMVTPCQFEDYILSGIKVTQDPPSWDILYDLAFLADETIFS